VGLYNYRWFLAFIGLHFVITVYGFVVGMGIFYGIIEEKQLLGAKFINNLTGETVTADWMFIFNWIMYHENALSFVVLLCAVCSVMLFFFFVYHMWMIKNGLTTNEKVKFGQAKYYIERSKSFLEEWLRIR
jgi:hypothetical protein